MFVAVALVVLVATVLIMMVGVVVAVVLGAGPSRQRHTVLRTSGELEDKLLKTDAVLSVLLVDVVKVVLVFPQGQFCRHGSHRIFLTLLFQ